MDVAVASQGGNNGVESKREYLNQRSVGMRMNRNQVFPQQCSCLYSRRALRVKVMIGLTTALGMNHTKPP